MQDSPRNYVVDEKPVRDDSFLSASARELCSHKGIFWAHAACLDVQGRAAAAIQHESCTATRCYHNMIKQLTLSHVSLQTESPQADKRRKREVEMIAMGSGTLQSGLACCHVDEAQCCALCEQGTISPRNTVEYGMTSWTGSYEVCVRVTFELKRRHDFSFT